MSARLQGKKCNMQSGDGAGLNELAIKTNQETKETNKKMQCDEDCAWSMKSKIIKCVKKSAPGLSMSHVLAKQRRHVQNIHFRIIA